MTWNIFFCTSANDRRAYQNSCCQSKLVLRADFFFRWNYTGKMAASNQNSRLLMSIHFELLEAFMCVCPWWTWRPNFTWLRRTGCGGWIFTKKNKNCPLSIWKRSVQSCLRCVGGRFDFSEVLPRIVTEDNTLKPFWGAFFLLVFFLQRLPHFLVPPPRLFFFQGGRRVSERIKQTSGLD